MFWSSKHCNQQSASIIRIANVPDGMSWDNQVALAEQQRAEGERLVAPPPKLAAGTTTTTTTTITVSRPSKQAQCKALSERVDSLDALARQGQSGQSQQNLREQRQAARDQQFRLGC